MDLIFSLVLIIALCQHTYCSPDAMLYLCCPHFSLSMIWTQVELSNTPDTRCTRTLWGAHSRHQFLSLHASRLFFILSPPATLSCQPISNELPNLKASPYFLSFSLSLSLAVCSLALTRTSVPHLFDSTAHLHPIKMQRWSPSAHI